MTSASLSTGASPDKKSLPILPPGALNLSRFSHLCTGCHLCVSICRTKAINTAFPASHFSHIFQPALNFKKGQCDYECNACGQICPTGAIAPISLNEKKQTRIGKAFLIEKQCIVYTKHKNCGACEKSCPTSAKSIIVTGLPVHEKALIHIPGNTKKPSRVDQKQDFPF